MLDVLWLDDSLDVVHESLRIPYRTCDSLYICVVSAETVFISSDPHMPALIYTCPTLPPNYTTMQIFEMPRLTQVSCNLSV